MRIYVVILAVSNLLSQEICTAAQSPVRSRQWVGTPLKGNPTFIEPTVYHKLCMDIRARREAEKVEAEKLAAKKHMNRKNRYVDPTRPQSAPPAIPVSLQVLLRDQEPVEHGNPAEMGYELLDPQRRAQIAAWVDHVNRMLGLSRIQ